MLAGEDINWNRLIDQGIGVNVRHQVEGMEDIQKQIDQVKWMAVGGLALGFLAWFFLRRKR